MTDQERYERRRIQKRDYMRRRKADPVRHARALALTKRECALCGGPRFYKADYCRSCTAILKAVMRPTFITAGMLDRFWSKVDRSAGPDACWPWTASTDPKTGYGQFTQQHGDSDHKAHRFAYRCAKGRIPYGQYVRHSCDNPPCCNPAHLDLGTPLDNSLDYWHRGRFVGSVPA